MNKLLKEQMDRRKTTNCCSLSALVPQDNKKDVWGSGGIDPRILNVGKRPW